MRVPHQSSCVGFCVVKSYSRSCFFSIVILIFLPPPPFQPRFDFQCFFLHVSSCFFFQVVSVIAAS